MIPYAFPKVVLLVIIPFAFFACNENSVALSNQAKPDTLKPVTIVPVENRAPELLPSVVTKGKPTAINIADVSIAIFNFIVYEDASELNKPNADSINVTADLGESIEGQVFEIKCKDLTDITMEQRYETSATIMNEGPHCDLLDWKHFISDWKAMPKTVSGQFIAIQYTEADRERFPEVSASEFRKKVLAHCGAEWKEQIKLLSSPSKEPAGVGISRYTIRITGTNKVNNQKVERLIHIEVPMGC